MKTTRKYILYYGFITIAAFLFLIHCGKRSFHSNIDTRIPMDTTIIPTDTLILGADSIFYEYNPIVPLDSLWLPDEIIPTLPLDSLIIPEADIETGTVLGRFVYKNIRYEYYKTFIKVIGFTVIPKGELVIPSKIANIPVRMIKSGAFKNCTGITSLTINFVEVVGREAFLGCININHINMLNIKIAANMSFYKMTNLKSVSMPLIQRIEYRAFYSCDNLSTAWIDINNQHFKLYGKALLSKDGTKLIKFFKGYTDNVYNVPSSVTTICDGAFFEYDALTEINMPNVVEIEEYAFYNCNRLVRLNLPRVKSIDKDAFAFSDNLTSVNMPVVSSMGNGVFAQCQSLTTVIMPMTSCCFIGNAFFKCPWQPSDNGVISNCP